MQKFKLALFLFVCFVVITLMAVGPVSAADDDAEDNLTCKSHIGDIPLDWRDGYRGEVVVQPNGVYQAECRYPYNYVYGTPRDYASILVQWCEDEQCGDFASYSTEFENPVESKKGKQALVVEKVTWPDNPQFINASQDFQEAKMKLLKQAEDRAISKEVKTTEDKKVSLTLEHVPPVFGKDFRKGGKIIVTVVDEKNEPVHGMNVLVTPDVGLSEAFENSYSYPYAWRIEEHQKQLGLTENSKAFLGGTNATGQATWDYSRRVLFSETDFYLDPGELGELLFEKAKSNEPLEGTIQAWCFEYERDPDGKELRVGKIHANASIPVKFTHIAEISSIGSIDPSQPPKVRAMRIDLDSWQSFFRAMGVSQSWSDIIRGSRAVVPSDLPYKLIPGDTILLDENDIVTVKWINGYEMVIKTKAGVLERKTEETGEPVQAHFTIMYGDLGKYRAIQEVAYNPGVNLGVGVGSVVIGFSSTPLGVATGLILPLFVASDYFLSDDPLLIETKSTILFDIDEYEEKATFYTVEGTGTLYNVNDGSTIDVTTGHKVTVSPDGEFGSVTGFDESELNEDLRTILDSMRGEDAGVFLEKGLNFESRSKASGSSIQIPLTLNGVQEDIGNMDMTLRYDSSVLAATEVVKGGLTTDSLFDYNIIDGTVKISFADKDGFSGDGSVAYVRFNVIGSEGSSSPLDIVSLSANRADLATLNIPDKDGVFKVIGPGEGIGDNDGDGVLTALDALAALQMAVGKIPEDLAMDVNGDGSVTSIDARQILRSSAKLS